MITAIDETGGFDPGLEEFNYFVAVHVDQNKDKYKIKESQFNIWEGSVPNKYKQNGEIKGNNLPDEYLTSFSNEVLEVKPSVLYSVVRVKPSETSEELMEKRKNYEIKSIENVISKARENNHDNWTKEYEKILAWYKNRNYQIMLKIICLEELLGMSLNRVLEWAQLTYELDDDISNIKDIKFKIDKDFIRADNVKLLWGELLRQYWQRFTKKEPLPVLVSWKIEDHPIYKVFDEVNGGLNIKKVFRDRTQFVDSMHDWEVRMADLVATIIHRYQNRNQCEEAGKNLLEHLDGTRKNYKHIIPNFDEEAQANQADAFEFSCLHSRT